MSLAFGLQKAPFARKGGARGCVLGVNQYMSWPRKGRACQDTVTSDFISSVIVSSCYYLAVCFYHNQMEKDFRAAA